MEFFEVIKKRRSIRQFKPDSVSREDILKILDAANWAPSAMNLQQWEFIVVSKNRINSLGNNYKVIVDDFTKDWEKTPDTTILSRDEFLRFAANYGGAPNIIVVLTTKSDDPGYQKAHLESASAAMENMILAATALRLGTCWMTGPLHDEKALRQLLKIPDNKEIVAITPLGYPAIVPKPRPRLDPDLATKVQWLE
jgi:nitroreductase